MSQLLLIKTAKPGKKINDVIGVFEDTHEFDANELNKFNVVSVKSTKSEIEALIKFTIQGLGGEEKQPVYEVNYDPILKVFSENITELNS
jgi:hypothetical protein